MLSLMVLRTAQLDAMLQFYRALGLTFVEEKHGSGPMHYACEMNGMVIELYPADAGTAPDRKSGGATMLGFKVQSVDAVIAELNIEPVTAPKDSPWGRRASLLDPDGRMIEISQPT